VIIASTLIGSISLLLFSFFLFGVSFTIAEFGNGTAEILAWDALLCLVFFVQHSTMIRKTFRYRLTAFVPQHYHGALYTIASGVCLIVLVLLWQNSRQTLVSLQGETRWLANGVFLASLIGMIWSMRALRSFDMFGIQPIMAHRGASHVRITPLTIRGPYRWVRHPAYFFILVMIWFRPDVTWDRLLFNALFTGWITLGTLLEERDLVADFREVYVDYHRSGPCR
jgi:protein-S-isoprenylcysteine O-methyltransferase Ste14